MVAALSVSAQASTGCGSKDDDTKKQPADPAADAEKRCLQLAKVCGDQEKHVQKLVDECKLAVEKLTAKGCTDKGFAVYDCYERDLCSGNDKVWALDDLRVLAERHKKCVTERETARSCVDNK